MIDATAVEREGDKSSVKTRYRHHPRHAPTRMHARVRADGSYALAEEDKEKDDAADPVAVLHDEPAASSGAPPRRL